MVAGGLSRRTAALGALFVSGCALFQGAGSTDPSPAQVSGDAVSDAPAFARGPAVPASSIGSGDVFEVRVFQEPDLSGVFRVSPQGTIDFPLCGAIQVAGATAPEVSERIQKCLAAGYLKNPQVSVFIKEYNSKKVFVLGEVHRPGTFTFEDGMTVIQAITLAGGFKEYAGKNSTSVTRIVDGVDRKIPVRVEDIGTGKAPNVLLQPGDIVYVPWSPFYN